jgi:hypothetical protein
MADLSAAVAQMLINGEGIRQEDSPDVWVDAILDRWPEISVDELERGFRIEIELQRADDSRRCGPIRAPRKPRSRAVEHRAEKARHSRLRDTAQPAPQTIQPARIVL